MLSAMGTSKIARCFARDHLLLLSLIGLNRFRLDALTFARLLAKSPLCQNSQTKGIYFSRDSILAYMI